MSILPMRVLNSRRNGSEAMTCSRVKDALPSPLAFRKASHARTSMDEMSSCDLRERHLSQSSTPELRPYFEVSKVVSRS